MNFFPFHPGDYMLRTAHLDPIEDLAYRRLIDLYYVNEAPLQGSAEELSRVIRLRKHSEQVAAVLQEFFVESDAQLWSHNHCDEVIDQYRLKARQAAENGKRGGRPKKTQSEPSPNPAITQPVISANPDETGSEANQEPITNNQIDQHNTQHADAENSPDPADPKSPVEMDLDWKPEPRLLAAYAKRQGLPVTLFTHEAIGSFVCHYSASNRIETQASWVSLLVKWIKRDTATGAAASNVRPFPVRQANGPDFDDTSWSHDLGAL